ncbi:MAG: ABC transporter ATP-binding protein [Rhodospirillales bacterium]|nr:ABC transporter ATP-binding protein [Rhodospirillales bacterium]
MSGKATGRRNPRAHPPPRAGERVRTGRILAIFLSTSRRQQAAVLSCLVLASLADGLGLASLLPALGAASGQSSADNPAQKVVVEIFAFLGLPLNLEVLLGVVVLALVLKAVLLLAAMAYVGYASAQVGTDLRLRLLDALLAARWGYFTRQPVGRFTNAISSEAPRASQAYLDVANFITGGVQSIVLLALCLLVSWRLSLLSAALGGIVVLVLGRLVRSAKRAGRQQTRRTTQLITRLTDALVGIKPLKAMARHAHLGHLFATDARALNRAQRRQILARQANRLLQEPLIGIFLVATFYVATKMLETPIQETIVMGIVLARTVASLGKAQQAYQAAAISESAYWAMRETIGEAERQQEVSTGTRPPALEREISFRDVSMSYGKRQVLEGFSLTVPAGRILTIIGPSGAGKTTIVDLLLGFHKPQSGEIRIDGVPLEELDLSAWRRRVGYVPQEVLLFHESVLTNITLGSPELDAEDARAALEAAGAWAFIEQLPEGLDTVVGERGALLSGGQRQRIAIARALVHRPSLLVLDEATSALDPATEAAICRNIQELSRRTGLTVIAISHQPTWTMVADEVLELPLRAVPEKAEAG